MAEGREADRGEALTDRPLRVRGQLLDRLAVDVDVAAHLVARLASEQRVYRLAAGLAGDVPERDVDRAEARRPQPSP